MPSRSASRYPSSSRLTADQEAYLSEREAQLIEHARATTMSGTHGELSRAASTSRSRMHETTRPRHDTSYSSRTHETTRPRRDTSYSSRTVVPPTSRSHASGRRTDLAGELGQEWHPLQPSGAMQTLQEETSSRVSRARHASQSNMQFVPHEGGSGLHRTSSHPTSSHHTSSHHTSSHHTSSRPVTSGTAVREASSRAGELQPERRPTSSQPGFCVMVVIERTHANGSRTPIAIAHQHGGSGHISIWISIHILIS